MHSFKATLLLSIISLARSDSTFQLDLNTANVSPDGFTRDAITINGQFQGPLLSVQKNDRIFANVSNSITDTNFRQSTSIHWHGMFQHKSATEDGVAMVTQCPIGPNLWYNYNFSTAGQTGTFWYHSHLSTQYCDGLRGPLVIYDPADPFADLYDVDDETTVITLGDWYHQPAEAEFANKAIIAPTPDSVLINNLGRYSGGPATPLAVIGVTSGLKYRFRLVNLSCRTFFTVSLDGHNFTVIEADGIEHEPLTVDSLTIFVGQRYSIIVDANAAIDNYWFRAVPGPSIVNQASSTDPGLNNAIFRYTGAPVAEPTTTATASTNPLVEANMIPLVNPGAPGGSAPADVGLNLVIGLQTPNWTINGASFFPPSVPVLLQVLSGNTTATSLLPAGDVYTLPKNSVIEISIPDAGAVAATHPFHLHGHAFDIVKSAGQTVPNYVNPPRRDVVAVNGGNVTFRFETDNAGPWVLHCHIDWHFSQGLAIVLVEDPTGISSGANATVPPPAWGPLCDSYNALPASEQ